MNTNTNTYTITNTINHTHACTRLINVFFFQGTKGQFQGKFTPGQHALMTNVTLGVRAIGNSVDDLSTAQDLPDLGSDPVSTLSGLEVSFTVF